MSSSLFSPYGERSITAGSLGALGKAGWSITVCSFTPSRMGSMMVVVRRWGRGVTVAGRAEASAAVAAAATSLNMVCGGGESGNSSRCSEGLRQPESRRQ